MKMKGLVLAMAVLLCTANAWATVEVTLSGSSTDAGAWYKTGFFWGVPIGSQNFEFNLTFTEPLENISSTYGYCVDLKQTFDASATYESKEIHDDFFQAAWLIDKYSTFTTSGNKIEGTTDDVTISALQAAVWNVLSPNSGNFAPRDPSWWDQRWLGIDSQRVYDLYIDMIASLDTIGRFDNLGLESKFQLLTTADYQDILVRTSTVPLPGAAVLFGSGLLGLVGLRRRQIR